MSAVFQLVAFEVTDGVLKVVAGSILATAVVIFALLMKEKKPWVRLPLAIIGLALAGWAIFLFAKGEENKTATSGAQTVASCRATLDTLDSLLRTKLANVDNVEAAKSISSEMQGVIERSSCKPS